METIYELDKQLLEETITDLRAQLNDTEHRLVESDELCELLSEEKELIGLELHQARSKLDKTLNSQDQLIRNLEESHELAMRSLQRQLQASQLVVDIAQGGSKLGELWNDHDLDRARKQLNVDLEPQLGLYNAGEISAEKFKQLISDKVSQAAKDQEVANASKEENPDTPEPVNKQKSTDTEMQLHATIHELQARIEILDTKLAQTKFVADELQKAQHLHQVQAESLRNVTNQQIKLEHELEAKNQIIKDLRQLQLPQLLRMQLLQQQNARLARAYTYETRRHPLPVAQPRTNVYSRDETFKENNRIKDTKIEAVEPNLSNSASIRNVSNVLAASDASNASNADSTSGAYNTNGDKKATLENTAQIKQGEITFSRPLNTLSPLSPLPLIRTDVPDCTLLHFSDVASLTSLVENCKLLREEFKKDHKPTEYNDSKKSMERDVRIETNNLNHINNTVQPARVSETKGQENYINEVDNENRDNTSDKPTGTYGTNIVKTPVESNTADSDVFIAPIAPGCRSRPRVYAQCVAMILDNVL